MLRRLINIPSPVIIFGLVILRAVIGFVWSQAAYFTTSRKPTQLEPLPVAAVHFVVVDAYWVVVSLYVETSDAQTYFMSWDPENNGSSHHEWQVSELPSGLEDTGETCSKSIVKRFERQLGRIANCRATLSSSEWCQGAALISFAIDQQGNVWQITQPQFCIFDLVVVPVIAIIGGVAGIILALLRWLFMKIFGRAEVKL